MPDSSAAPQKLCCICGSILRVPVGDLPVHRLVVERWRKRHNGEGHALCDEATAHRNARAKRHMRETVRVHRSHLREEE